MKRKKFNQCKNDQSDMYCKNSKRQKTISSAEDSQLIRSKTKVKIQTSLDQNPWCAHGPTILFERICPELKDYKPTAFYSCSAYRDRKECGAYFPADNDLNSTVSKQKMLKWKQILTLESNIKRPQIPEHSPKYCKNCNELVSNDSTSHKSHKLIPMKENEASLPTLNNLLVTKHVSTKEAQYHFSNSTLKVLLNQFILQSNKSVKVVCVGTPRIHESIVSSNLKGTAQDIKSILLDIDVRLRPFYDSSSSTWGTFCHYNMFNHFFFRDTEREEYLTFLKGNEDVIIITDPPFGGKCELIARSLNIIREDVTKVRNRESTANIMWIFPYYMERQIQQEITDIKMSDYQVCYETKDANSYKDGLETGNSGSRKVRLI